MFRLVCFVEDKKLVPVLKLLTGNVLNMEPPQAILSDNGSGLKSGKEVFQSMPKDFTRAEMDEAMVKIGLSPKSTNSFLQNAKKAGLAKMIRRGHWRKTK